MKAVNPQNQVQAGNLNANGGILGAMVGAYATKKAYETKYAYQTSLMEFDDKLRERRQLTGTVHKIVADQVGQASQHNYSMVQEAAKSKNKLDQIKTEASQKRRTIGYEMRTGLNTTKKMTAGLETSAGLPLSGGISPLVAGPNQYQGQLQAFKSGDNYHPHMGMGTNPASTAGQAPDVMTPDTSNPGTPTGAKGGRGKKVKPFADPSVAKNVKPVPSEVAAPFSAPATRSTIFADASSPKTSNTPAAETPAAAAPKARIKKA
jgi:hypothetical protein